MLRSDRNFEEKRFLAVLGEDGEEVEFVEGYEGVGKAESGEEREGKEDAEYLLYFDQIYCADL